MTQVVGQGEVARERVGERLVEVEHLQKLVAPDNVQVAVGQGTDISCRLADC